MAIITNECFVEYVNSPLAGGTIDTTERPLCIEDITTSHIFSKDRYGYKLSENTLIITHEHAYIPGLPSMYLFYCHLL